MKFRKSWKSRLREVAHLARMGTRTFRPTGSGPELLCLFVTTRCEGKCKHCFDWRRRGPDREAEELSFDEWIEVSRKLSSPYFLIMTGGEPFLREDITELVEAFARNSRPRVLAIPTSGNHPEVVEDSVRRMLMNLPAETRLSLNVSIDGVGEMHDRIRGVPGIFDRAVETVARLRELAESDPALGVGVVTVISRHNQDHLREIMELVLDQLGISIWAPFLTRGESRDSTAGDVDIERYVEISRLLEQRILQGSYQEYRGFMGARINNAKNVVRREVIQRTVLEGRRIVPCLAGRHSAVVWSNGDVHPCELLDAPMGNLRECDYDLRRLWKSTSASEARSRVISAGCACTHENTLTTSIAFDPHQWSSLLRWVMTFSGSPHLGPGESRTETDVLKEKPGGDERKNDSDTGVEISCFIPAYNEEYIILSTVRNLERILSRNSASHEICVVDDGSTDDTADRIRSLGNDGTRVLRYEDGPSFRANLSRSLLTGSGEYVMFMDADLMVSEEDIAEFLNRLRSGADVVIGSRYIPGARAIRTPMRFVLSKTYNQLLRIALKSPFLDHQCGLKAFRAEVLEKLLKGMQGHDPGMGWFWDAELLIRAVRMGYRVDEIPVSWTCRMDSRSMLMKQFRILPWIVRLYRERTR